MSCNSTTQKIYLCELCYNPVSKEEMVKKCEPCKDHWIHNTCFELITKYNEYRQLYVTEYTTNECPLDAVNNKEKKELNKEYLRIGDIEKTVM